MKSKVTPPYPSSSLTLSIHLISGLPILLTPVSSLPTPFHSFQVAIPSCRALIYANIYFFTNINQLSNFLFLILSLLTLNIVLKLSTFTTPCPSFHSIVSLPRIRGGISRLSCNNLVHQRLGLLLFTSALIISAGLVFTFNLHAAITHTSQVFKLVNSFLLLLIVFLNHCKNEAICIGLQLLSKEHFMIKFYINTDKNLDTKNLFFTFFCYEYYLGRKYG